MKLRLRLLLLVCICSSHFNALSAESPFYINTKAEVIVFTDPVFTGVPNADIKTGVCSSRGNTGEKILTEKPIGEGSYQPGACCYSLRYEYDTKLLHG